MAKLTGRKFLSDNVVNARRNSTPRPQRVTIISGGMRYAPGRQPAQVCPAGTLRVLRGVLARAPRLLSVTAAPPVVTADSDGTAPSPSPE